MLYQTQSNLEVEKVKIVLSSIFAKFLLGTESRMEQWRIVSVLMLDQLEQDPLGAGVTNYNDDKVCTGKWICPCSQLATRQLSYPTSYIGH